MCKGVKSEKDFISDKGKLCRNCNECRFYLKSYGSVKENHERRILQRRERYNTIPEIKKKHANYYQKNKDNIVFKRKKQAIHLKRKYNLTLEDYDRMMTEQNNKCAICKEKFTESFKDWNRPCVDHNHQTNKVRGLLCRKCNVTQIGRASCRERV